MIGRRNGPADAHLAFLGRLLLGSALLLGSGCPSNSGSDAEATDPLHALPAATAEPRLLRIGITPGAGPETAGRVEALGQYLNRTMPVPVELEVASDYSALARLVDSSEVQVAIFNPLAYVEQRRNLPVIAIASATHDGSPTYSGYLVVTDSHRFGSLGSIRGARIAWVDPASTSGFLYPRQMLRWRGYDPDQMFSEQHFAGDHLRAVAAVRSGEADVAAVASAFVDPGPYELTDGANQLEVIAKTARIPLDAVAVRTDLHRDTAARLRTALLALDRAAESRALEQHWGIGGFVASSDRAYDVVEAARRAELSER